MTDDVTKIAFVVATKDRPEDIRKLLDNLSGQSVRPDQVVIVDSSMHPDESITEEFPNLIINYIRHRKPSASAQRNVGIEAADQDIDLIGFLDDDVVLEQGAMENMMKFWQTAAAEIAGCAFNLKNFESTGAEWLKHSKFSKKLGLYSNEKGIVMPTGWQTMIGTVDETIFVEWLPSTASVWRKNILRDFKFEEYFDGYSYLEDLDFSFSVSRRYKLAVIPEAGFYHYHSPSGRTSNYNFGKMEVVNRVFFVRKHGLSLFRCYLAILIRLLMTIISSTKGKDKRVVQRAIGNCVGIYRSFFF